jgi:outer membrane immunogenic protein
MRTKMLGAMALLSIGTAPAFAADLPARIITKAPAATGYSWSGFYVGANGGWGTSANCWNLTNNVLA